MAETEGSWGLLAMQSGEFQVNERPCLIVDDGAL